MEGPHTGPYRQNTCDLPEVSKVDPEAISTLPATF